HEGFASLLASPLIPLILSASRRPLSTSPPSRAFAKELFLGKIEKKSSHFQRLAKMNLMKSISLWDLWKNSSMKKWILRKLTGRGKSRTTPWKS
uniref:Uncharacterized protein n=1 Tax=Spermophilus dauricus TaxID=99837 RepID=A0A8C9PL23_SPEDA